MDLKNIITEIKKSDHGMHDCLDDRRTCLRKFAGLAGKITMTALPIAMGSMFKKAYGQSEIDIAGVLNFALTFEYLESGFYSLANAGHGPIPPGPGQEAFATIGAHESAHVEFLTAAITASGGTPVSKPDFDFTAGGTFSDVFTNYETFLAVAQTLEDTSVRAYKGMVSNLIGTSDVLTSALNIHSVEARHASHIRKIRKAMGVDIKPWITGKNSGIGSIVQPSYDGEENIKQADIEIVNIDGQEISEDAASEAFDEPLSKEQVMAIISPFIQ